MNPAAEAPEAQTTTTATPAIVDQKTLDAAAEAAFDAGLAAAMGDQPSPAPDKASMAEAADNTGDTPAPETKPAKTAKPAKKSKAEEAIETRAAELNAAAGETTKDGEDEEAAPRTPPQPQPKASDKGAVASPSSPAAPAKTPTAGAAGLPETFEFEGQSYSTDEVLSTMDPDVRGLFSTLFKAVASKSGAAIDADAIIDQAIKTGRIADPKKVQEMQDALDNELFLNAVADLGHGDVRRLTRPDNKEFWDYAKARPAMMTLLSVGNAEDVAGVLAAYKESKAGARNKDVDARSKAEQERQEALHLRTTPPRAADGRFVQTEDEAFDAGMRQAFARP